MKRLARLAAAIALLVVPQACSGSAASDPGTDAGGAGGERPDSALDGTGGDDDAGAIDADGGATDAEAGIDAGQDASADADASTLREECRASAYGGDYACGMCWETKCGAECSACFDDPECLAWLDCAKQCGDIACQDDCSAQHPAGEAPVLAWLDGCPCAACGGDGTTSGICDTGLTVNDKPCDTCLGDNCCQLIKDCLADSACEDCLMNGTSDGCGGNVAYATLDTCWGVTCGSACGGGGGTCGLSNSDATCESCLEINCCDQATACFESPGCLGVLTCMQECAVGDTMCEDDCAAADPAGAALLNDFYGCLGQSCASECNPPATNANGDAGP